MSIVRLVSAIALTAMLGACASSGPRPSTPAEEQRHAQGVAQRNAAAQSNTLRVPLTASRGGTPVVQVEIAGVCCIGFTVDSGASDVSVSPALWYAMVKGGHITKEDHIDVVKYQTANGVTEGLRFRMPAMAVGGRTVHGVIGSVSKNSNAMLLGQSFLRKFRFWAIDNASGDLVLGL